VSAESTRAGELLHSIAKSTGEQARGAARVEQAMAEVHNTARSLREIVTAELAASERLREAMASNSEVMKRSVDSSSAQASQVESVLAALGSVFGQIRKIYDMNQRQAASRERVARAFSTLSELSEQHRQSAKLLAGTVVVAAAQSRALADSVELFKV